MEVHKRAGIYGDDDLLSIPDHFYNPMMRVYITPNSDVYLIETANRCRRT